MPTYFDITSEVNMGLGPWIVSDFDGASTALNATVTLGASGGVAMGAGGSVSLTVTRNATSLIATSSPASRASVITTGASGSVAVFATATTAINASIHATRVSAFEVLGQATLTVSTAQQAASLVRVSSGGNVNVVSTITSSGVVRRVAGANATNVTISTSSAGFVKVFLITNTTTPTVSLNASGSVHKFGSSTVPITITPSNTVGALSMLGAATLELTNSRTTEQSVYVPFPFSRVPTKRTVQLGWPWAEVDRGVTLLKDGGVWGTATGAYDARLETAEYIYRGGRTYPINNVEVSELIAAGYGSSIYYE